MYTKTKAAFLISAFRFFERNPRVYFWTFTFRQVKDDVWYMYQWSEFLRYVQDRHGRIFTGLRVVEAGEGGHGLHFHALVNRRFAVQIMRRLGKRFGIGRIQVVRCDEGAAWYLSKYMGKDSLPLAKGIRRWAAIGGYKPTKVNSVVVESTLTENIRWIQERCKVRQIPYDGFQYVSKQTMLYGVIANWPREKLRCVGTNSAIVNKAWSPMKYRGSKYYANRPF